MGQTNKFLRKLILFLSPGLVFVVVLFAMPLDKRFAYHFIKNDCEDHAAWMYDRMVYNKTPMDVVILGTSQTRDAVMDSIVEERLQQLGTNKHIVNFGYCRFGRNFQYSVIKDLLKHKNVDEIILEVGSGEERLSHVDFPYVADSRDVLFPVVVFNQKMFGDIFKALGMRFELFKAYVLGRIPEYDIHQGGYGCTPCGGVAEEQVLADAKRSVDSPRYKSSDMEKWFNQLYPLAYLEKIVALAKEHHCRVSFLYLPSYGNPAKPKSYDLYRSYGDVYLPPMEILTYKPFWSDHAHLNSDGALKFSEWLSGELAMRRKQ